MTCTTCMDSATTCTACGGRMAADMRKRAEKAEALNARLVEALESIRQYGSDTLSGPVGEPDTRDWQRAGVVEMTKRARAVLAEVKR